MRLSGVQLANVANSRPKLLLANIHAYTGHANNTCNHAPHHACQYDISYFVASRKLIISIFLGVVAIVAFKRNDTTRLLFMSLGFVSLIIIESLFLLFATINVEDIIISCGADRIT